jgi:hypothetical protein
LIRTRAPRHAAQDEEIGEGIDHINALEFAIDADLSVTVAAIAGVIFSVCARNCSA